VSTCLIIFNFRWRIVASTMTVSSCTWFFEANSALLSVVTTRKQAGETFLANEFWPELSEVGISIYQSSVQRFQIAAFESREHMVYVISDLPGQYNTELMQGMAPALKTFLGNLES
jgi:hypothetical protein